MRLLAHNLLMCNVKTCDKNNYPLIIIVTKSQIIESEFKKEALIKLIPKLDWPALYKTVTLVNKKPFKLKNKTLKSLETPNSHKN